MNYYYYYYYFFSFECSLFQKESIGVPTLNYIYSSLSYLKRTKLWLFKKKKKNTVCTNIVIYDVVLGAAPLPLKW